MNAKCGYHTRRRNIIKLHLFARKSKPISPNVLTIKGNTPYYHKCCITSPCVVFVVYSNSFEMNIEYAIVIQFQYHFGSTTTITTTTATTKGTISDELLAIIDSFTRKSTKISDTQRYAKRQKIDSE